MSKRKPRAVIPGVILAEHRLLAAALEYSRTISFPGSFTSSGIVDRRENLLLEAIDFSRWVNKEAGK